MTTSLKRMTAEQWNRLHPLARSHYEGREPLLEPLLVDSIDSVAKVSVTNETGAKTKKVASRYSLFFRACEGLGRSRIFRAVLLSGLTAGLLVLFLSNPAGWIIAAAATTVFVLKLILPNPSKTKQALEFELGMFARLFTQHKYNEIPIPTNDDLPEVILGVYPNRLWGEH